MPDAPPLDLPVPQSVRDADEAAEICRAWVADGRLHVTLQQPFDDPAAWGVALVDIARHVARAYEDQGDMTFEAALARIGELWRAELARPTDFGSTARQ